MARRTRNRHHHHHRHYRNSHGSASSSSTAKKRDPSTYTPTNQPRHDEWDIQRLCSRPLSKLRFSTGGYKLLTLPNAGGNSVLSEALSFELLQRCFRATLLKTEMEVQYFPMGGSMTDYVCSLCGRDIAVSVTRAMKFRGDYTEEDAEQLLNKKLKGVVQSNHNVVEKWSKQILHVWATSSKVAKTIITVFGRIDPKVKANTVVLVTTAMQSQFIFENG